VADGEVLEAGFRELGLAGATQGDVGGPALDRVLRAMSHVDLQRVATLNAYRQEVRAAAKRLLG
jgi:hypothetical protein